MTVAEKTLLDCTAPRPVWTLLTLILGLMLLVGCSPAATVSQSTIPAPQATPVRAEILGGKATETPHTIPTPTALQKTPTAALRLWTPETLPQKFVRELALPRVIQKAAVLEEADLWLAAGPADPAQGAVQATSWYYALVAPFPTLVDGVSENDLLSSWQGRARGDLKDIHLLVSQETRAVFENEWGAADPQRVETVDSSKLLESAWDGKNLWAIVPFEEIGPRWKVLRINGISPLEKPTPENDLSGYPLAVSISLVGEPQALELLRAQVEAAAWKLPSNYDPEKLTVLAMTGVTALSRRIAEKMESEGVTYPARDIGEWLREADLTHVSNEVSFFSNCPKPRPDMRFCSRPKYIQLLEEAGVDIIELTGNHNLDWGPEPYLESLKMYAERDWKVFGGGATLAEAQAPLFIEHNGNRLVLLGCSPAGPQNVWATEKSPGSAPCDLDQMEQTVRDLRSQGYLPVVTFQHIETDWYIPTIAQRMPDFKRMAQAGAVVVSGSQSHFPQTMTFVGESFVHYGLGNLFFDQMEPKEIRQAFIDRHIFYNGRYLGTDLLTTMLEDSARPRPMTREERWIFLEKVFGFSNWSGK